MTLGAVTGGIFIKRGRRFALIISCIIGIIGVSLSLIEIIYILLIGRFIYGLSIGLISVAIPRYIDEVVP
jgi:MFS family permease